MDIQITSNASGSEATETGMMGLPVGGSTEVESDTYIEEKFASMLDDSLVEAVLEDGDITETMGEDLVVNVTESDASDEQEMETTLINEQVEQSAPALTIVETTETESTEATNTTETETSSTDQTKLKQIRLEPLQVLDESSVIELDEREEGLHQASETEQPEPDQAVEQSQKHKAVDTINTTSKLELVKENEQTVEQRESSAIETFDETFPEGWETLLEDEAPPAEGEKNMRLVTANDNGQGDETMTNAIEKDGKQPSLLDYGKEQSQQQSEKQAQLQPKMERIEGGSQAVSDAELGATEFVENPPQVKAPMTQPLRPVTTAAQVLEQMSQVQKQSAIKHFTQETIQGLHGKEELLKIELRPPELGRVDMMVQKSGDSVHAKIIIADAGVGEFFQENMDQLRKNIEASGLKLGDLTVEIKQDNGQSLVDEETEASDDKHGSFGASEKVAPKTSMKSRMYVNNQQLSKMDMLI